MPPSTLPRRKLRDQVAERIKELIATAELRPGDRLPTESELAGQLGVSRLSVREATKALEFLGIVTAKTGVGLTVGQLDVAQIVGHLGYFPALHQVEPRELIDSRVVVETGVLPFVAQRMATDPGTYDRLAALVEQFRSVRELEIWIELDIEFHRTLLELSGLTPLVAFGDLLEVFFQRFRGSVARSEWPAGIASHQRIIDDLRDQKVVQARDELRQHIESHLRRLRPRDGRPSSERRAARQASRPLRPVARTSDP